MEDDYPLVIYPVSLKDFGRSRLVKPVYPLSHLTHPHRDVVTEGSSGNHITGFWISTEGLKKEAKTVGPRGKMSCVS